MSTPTLLLNDTPLADNAPVPDDYQFDVHSNDHTVVGVWPKTGDNFDIEVYTDTTFATLIESSTFAGDVVDFVVLDKTAWTSPPNRGTRVTSGSTSYVIEMENDVDDHLVTDMWSGTMISYPVLNPGPPGSWDDQYVYYPTVLYDGMTYHMWYGGKDGTYIRIGYATSPDGIKWTKSGANPVLNIGPPGSWEEAAIWAPMILYDSMTSTYKMWYSGSDGMIYKIGYATSPDGITWTKCAVNPVLNPGPPGSWDDYRVYTPMVYYDGITYHMWYSGGESATTVRIGYATSPDGITWTKNTANPVLDLGPSGSWEDFAVFAPTILQDANASIYRMWYAGFNGTNYRIGYATSPDGIAWTKYPSNPVLDVGLPSSWDELWIWGPMVLYDGTTHHMWYSGTKGTYQGIGYATSIDGINWAKIPSEVFDAYEITGTLAGLFYTINMDVPTTLDLDLFIFNTTGGRINAIAASANTGPGICESISFIALATGDYLLVITNEASGTGTYTINSNKPPLADAGGPYLASENSPIILDASASYDPDGIIVSHEWDLDNDGTYDDATGLNPMVTFWNDDYSGTIGLMVTDDDGLTATATTTVTITNVDPTASIISVTMGCGVGLRVTGSKWSNVELTLFEEGVKVGTLEVERWPAGPGNNPFMGSLPTTLDMTKSYGAVVTYDPYPDDGDDINGDQPNNGKDPHDNAGNPVWLTFDCNGGSKWVHHTFNTQQSKKRDSDHPNHVEPWIVDINKHLKGLTFTIEGYSDDQGSDDLTFTWTYKSQSVAATHLNNPPSPDPYYSPYTGTAPIGFGDSMGLVYSGPGTVTLTTSDDDEGQPTDTPGSNSASMTLG